MSELALTDRESRRLRELESNIRNAGGTMYESLKAIHDEKLYRADFKTWEEYCDTRWKMSRHWAYRIIQHGAVLALLNENAPDLLTDVNISEAATREVAGLPDDHKVEVLQEVAEESKSKNNGKPKVTGPAVRRKVKQKAEESVACEEEGNTPAVSVVLDAIGRPVPAHLKQRHETAAKLNSVGTKLDQVKREIKELVDEAGGVFLPLQQIEIAIKDVKGLIVQSRYYTECPRCRGKVKDTCDRCDGHGFLPYSRKGTLSDDDKLWLGVK